MAELDSLQLKNVTNEDFTQYYNGEPYTVRAGETKAFAQYVAFHIAKHLSTKMIVDEATALLTKDEVKELTTDIKSRIASKLAQLYVYDTPERRIALYKMFGDKQLVERVITSYPFKGFIGNMADYDRFVAMSSEPVEEKPLQQELEREEKPRLDMPEVSPLEELPKKRIGRPPGSGKASS